MSFIHPHVHTDYSNYGMQDSVNRIDNIIKRLKELNQTAWCITDHNTCSGITDAYKKSKKAGIKLIPGAELYLTADLTIQQRNLHHITFWAKDNEGLHNLFQLATEAHGNRGNNPNNYYYKSRVDIDLIRKYSKGLMVGTACLGGFVNSPNGEEYLVKLLEIFPNDLFLELHTYQCDEQYVYNGKLIELSQKYNIPLIAATDAHFTWKYDADLRRLFKNTSKEQDESENVDDSLYVQSEDEIREYLKYLPKEIVEQSLVNTQLLSEKSNVEIVFGQKNYPHFPCDNPLEEVKVQCRKGWNEKIKGSGVDYKKYGDRLIYELGVLDKQDYCSYFLITADYINKARNKGIPVGPGRGSVVACKTAELMGITQVDSIKYNLTFERFAHNERIAPPDIDVDVSKKRRYEVIEQLAEDYGEVLQCRTFAVEGARGGIRRAGSALGWTQDDINALIKTISKYEPDDNEEELSSYEQKMWILDYIKNESNAELIELAKRFVGIIKGYGKHASCVIILDSDITRFCSVERQTDSKTGKPCYIAACAFPLLEEQGLMKADVLGLKTLDVIYDTIELSGQDIDINKIPLDCPKTSQMLCEGGTSGCFQIESPGMTQLVKQIKPKEFADLIPLVALYRPGPLDATVEETGDTMVQTYVKVRNYGKLQLWLRENLNKNEDQWPQWKANGGELKVEDVIAPKYLHPKLEPILGSTYSIILYQEQILEIAKELCGYSLGEADILRRIIGKKKIDEMKPALDKLIERGVANGIPRDAMEKISEQIVTFALYGFNKGHSAAYGLVAYQTAYLKAHFPLEFMCATINSEEDVQENIIPYIDECKRLGIEVLPPDICYSQKEWIIEDGNLRMGLTYIKGLGNNIDLSDSSSYEAIRSNNNKRVVEALIKSGSIDHLGERKDMLKKLYQIEESVANYANKIRQALQKIETLESDIENAKNKETKKYVAMLEQLENRKKDVKKWSKKLEETKNDEKSLQKYDECAGEVDVLSFSFKEIPRLKQGTCTNIFTKLDKNNNEMGWVTLESPYGEYRCTVFWKKWSQIKSKVVKGNSYLFIVDDKNILVDLKEVV